MHDLPILVQVLASDRARREIPPALVIALEKSERVTTSNNPSSLVMKQCSWIALK
jgi:hypothetical protein